ncbi:GNAT family N-acetyltransferase [Flammeovirga sp. EKP202]|uniref:GNAT family N-acetyltransferase n=1 Tax=Flammeovirga sp. EKP202 TaxID=2770592 RepID=UPI00165ECE6A|nr:GNAT family N-acetyltransferase [Flammeovirga sp. EKP202]MBD0401766.1 GNAT family N-acetyltransferase [Flammeovirga sp. EKP202]
MNLRYINNTQQTFYNEAKKIRVKCFFEGLENADYFINDPFEQDGFHLVCLNDQEKVIGTGRLNIVDKMGVISQMAIAPENQNQGIGKIILNELIEKGKLLDVDQIKLSARLTAQSFYVKKGFEPLGHVYPSQKTGIMHIDMILML